MAPRILSVSAAPYDGYEFAEIVDSVARCGATHVEPAFIVGYTEPFDESAFTPGKALRYAAWLAGAGLKCHAFSSHIDLGREDAVEVFKGRMDFAARIGAKVINTNAAARANSERFFRNIEPLARHAEQLGLTIGLENPGDGSDNLVNVAADGSALLARLGLPCVGLNYDAGNVISHRPAAKPGGVDPATDAIAALPACIHTHVKDVRLTPEGYFFVPIGDGDIGCQTIVEAIARTTLDVSIEIPLRLHRGPDALPRRRPEPVPLAEIETTLRASLDFVKHHLGGTTP